MYTGFTESVLIDVSIAPSLGFSSYKENLGEVENSGVELSLKGTVLRDVKREWTGIFSSIWHTIKNKVKKINKALTAFNADQDSKVENKPMIRYKEGLSQKYHLGEWIFGNLTGYRWWNIPGYERE